MSGTYDVVRYNPLTEVQEWKFTEVSYDTVKKIHIICPCGHIMYHIKHDNINLYCVHHQEVPEAVLVTYYLLQ